MVTLRRASASDESRLLAWRNDAATRASAFDGEEIPAEVHRAWLRRKLADPACAILIAEEGGGAVGQLRFDRVGPDLAEVDIAVAPEARGRGIAREILGLGLERVENLLGVTRVRALVKPDNQPSLRAFRAAGFQVEREREDAVELERTTGA
jgi:RimJ/RimL family protein N-acetyltransferase